MGEGGVGAGDVVMGGVVEGDVGVDEGTVAPGVGWVEGDAGTGWRMRPGSAIDGAVVTAEVGAMVAAGVMGTAMATVAVAVTAAVAAVVATVAGVAPNREGMFFSQQIAPFFIAASCRAVSGGGVAGWWAAS